MYEQASLLSFKVRYLLAILFVAAFVVLTSALVTAIGSGTVLAKAHQSTSSVDPSISNSPNAITAGASQLASATQSSMISAGSGIYGACRSITNTTRNSGKYMVRGSAVIFDGAWSGTVFIAHGFGDAMVGTGKGALFVAKGFGDVAVGAGRGIAYVGKSFGNAAMFTLKLPIKAVASLTGKHTVGGLIQPAENDSTTVPVISTETSAASLAHLSVAKQQKVAKLQAAQKVANHKLDGTIVAGDPNRGGYPASWADAPQDSSLDSWGMYNRECVSYVAWKVYQSFGHMPYWGGVGNASEWPGDARSAGIPTGSIPRVHSVAISMGGYYGHAMWVEKVRGNMIYVSQYNYYLNGQYSEMWVNGSYFTYIYFK